MIDRNIDEIQVGAIVEGTVQNITNYGAFVDLPNGFCGLIHISEISDGFVENVNDYLQIGQKVRVKVLGKGMNDGKIKINLSLKQSKETMRFIPQNIPEDDRPRRNIPVFELTIPEENNALEAIKQSPFRFVLHTVIRPIKNENPVRKAEAILKGIVDSMSKGFIGSFEINLLYWIAQLRFSNKAMLTKLMEGGFIDRSKTVNTNLDKLMDKKLDLLINHEMIMRVRFQSLDESGQNTISRGIPIYIMNKAGNTTLKELGLTDAKYNAFDIVQDGNTVKRILAVNQWLIFMLVHFPEIGDNFELANIFNLMTDEHASARFFGSVVCNGETLVGEAIRRVEDFEKHALKNSVSEKCARLIRMFAKFNEIYITRSKGGRDKFVIPRRPILIYICEDDAHISEVREEILSEVINENPEQQIYFTTDLKIFNEDLGSMEFLKLLTVSH